MVRFNNFWERRIPDKRKGVNVDLLVMSENKGPDAAIHSKAQFEKFKKRLSREVLYFETIGITNIDASSPIYWRGTAELQRKSVHCEIIPQAVYDACLQGIRHKYNNLTHPFPHVYPDDGYAWCHAHRASMR